MLTVLLTTGCGLNAPITPLFSADAPATSPTSVVVRGDFDDIPAAVYAASVASEAVDIRVTSPTPETVHYEMVTIHGAPGTLDFTLREDGLIAMTCKIGRFGEPQREQRVLAAVAARLEELHGKTAAPVKDRVPPRPAAPP